MDLTTDLADLASRQHGLLLRRDLADAGVSRQRTLRLQRRGVLERLGPRTLRVAGSPRSERQGCLAACYESGGLLSHRSAIRLHGLGRFPPLDRPEVLVLRPVAEHDPALACVHSTTWLPASDHLLIDGIPTTSVARTLFCLAGMANHGVPLRTTRELVDQAVRERKATDAWLWAHLEGIRRRGRRGVRAMESILSARNGEPTESWLEAAFLDLVRAAGLPMPRCQARIGRDGAFLARVDFLYADHGLVIEVTGNEGHASATQRAADARRRNELQLDGHEVLEFTYQDVVETPAMVVDAVRRALAKRSAQTSSHP